MAVAPYITGMPGSRAPHAPPHRPLTAHPHLLHSVVVPSALVMVLIAVAAYLLGSIPFGYILMRIFRKQDIRAFGSGNIGATNVLRTGAHGLGLATFVLDTLKGSTAVLLGGYLAALWLPGVPVRTAEALAALCAVLGHMFPIWLRFGGGKGVATGFGVFLVVSPWAALAALATFVAVTAITRYVAIGSMISAASFPVYAWFMVTGDRPAFFFIAGVCVSSLIVIKHHTNIRRLIDGTEYKLGAKNQA